jgi:hypothetical protein
MVTGRVGHENEMKWNAGSNCVCRCMLVCALRQILYMIIPRGSVSYRHVTLNVLGA